MSRVKELKHRLCLVVLLAALVLFGGCGIKGAPVPSGAPVPPRVYDLEVAAVGDNLRLTWSLPKEGDTVMGGLYLFKLYKYRSHHLARWCPDCPIPFKLFMSIRLRDPWPAWIEDDRVVYDDTVDAEEYRYAYKVVVYHSRGGVSKDSNIAIWPALSE